MMSVVGFGSLLSQRSSRFTFPELQNFRLARLKGFRRVFAHVTPFFLHSYVYLCSVRLKFTSPRHSWHNALQGIHCSAASNKMLHYAIMSVDTAACTGSSQSC